MFLVVINMYTHTATQIHLTRACVRADIHIGLFSAKSHSSIEGKKLEKEETGAEPFGLLVSGL